MNYNCNLVFWTKGILSQLPVCLINALLREDYTSNVGLGTELSLSHPLDFATPEPPDWATHDHFS